MLASPVVFGAMLMFGVAVLAGEKPIIPKVTAKSSHFLVTGSSNNP